ncbi:hypothetical protein BDW22DRAFT_1428518 [Trametopsis cervina]|nr:hypothetical protein BDW22DRAFT_1428518 [Trametopsis cervina]
MASNNHEDADPAFLALPARLRRRIDSALDAALTHGSEADGHNDPPRKRRRTNTSATKSPQVDAPGGFLSEEPPAAGGFVIDDEDQPMGGGFVPEGDTANTNSRESSLSAAPDSDHEGTEDVIKPTRIPLNLIPRALQLLDLSPDDEDVIDVFRNAASGWENRGSSHRTDEHADSALFVSRKDWRAVCAALLDASAQDDEMEEDVNMDNKDVQESEGSEEDYVQSEDGISDDAEEDGSEDEYHEGGFMRPSPSKQRGGKGKSKATPARKTRRRRGSDSSVLSDDEVSTQSKHITPRQKAESRRMFSLFFPDTPESQLDGRRIMIKDVSRVAEILKEKITVEEIVEMLEAFSTSPDKSMSLSDFEAMMVATQMA